MAYLEEAYCLCSWHGYNYQGKDRKAHLLYIRAGSDTQIGHLLV